MNNRNFQQQQQHQNFMYSQPQQQQPYASITQQQQQQQRFPQMPFRPPPPTMNMNEFPALGVQPNQQNSNQQNTMDYYQNTMQYLQQNYKDQQNMSEKEFTLQNEDFPALGAPPQRKNYNEEKMYQQQQQTSPTTQSTAQQQPPKEKAISDRFGLLGLLGVIRMTDQDLNTLALGCDLTTLGLNLNSTEPLHASFLSPWNEQPMEDGNMFKLPDCYRIGSVPDVYSKLPSFSEETLFYIFYSMPQDPLQHAAAQELFKRNWRYHKELKAWLTKDPNAPELVYTKAPQFEKGVYIFWDIIHWCKVSREFVLYYDALEEPPKTTETVPVSSTATTSNGTRGKGGSLQLAAGNQSLQSGDPVMFTPKPAVVSTLHQKH